MKDTVVFKELSRLRLRGGGGGVHLFITNIRRRSRSEKCAVGTPRVNELQLTASLIIKDIQRLLPTDNSLQRTPI